MSFGDENLPLPQQVADMADAQARDLWRLIERTVKAGGVLVAAPLGVTVAMPSGAMFSNTEKPLAHAAAHVLNCVAVYLDEAASERGSLLDRLVEDTEPVLSAERDVRPEEGP